MAEMPRVTPELTNGKIMSASARTIPEAAADVLGWSLGLRARSTADVLDCVKAGFTPDALERIRAFVGLDDDEIARILGTSLRTLARRRKAGRLDSEESDRLYRIARQFERAVDVFGGDGLAAEEARQWFHTPLWALGHETPLSYLQTETGAMEVDALLDRIDYSVLA